MARAQHLSWYRIAVARPDAPAQLLAVEGAHLGEAVAAAEAHAKSYAVGVDLATSAPLGESLRKQIAVLGDDTEHTPSFRWPSGVLPQLGHAAKLAGARRGYVEHPDPKLLVIEAMTDAEHLVDLFLGVVERKKNGKQRKPSARILPLSCRPAPPARPRPL